MRRRRCAIIAVHTLVGIGLIGVSLGLYVQLLLHGKEYRARLSGAGPFLKSLIGYATLAPLFVGVFVGLNLGFGVHPLGTDYHRPSTYVFALIVPLACDALGRYFIDKLSHPKEPYSAVSDDWLLWEKRSGEANLRHHQSPA